ncbi:hypothetical protein BVX98_03630 [bacterium F11]|nr:hypothetical protein BVX98_03630 [bacterium F11]
MKLRQFPIKPGFLVFALVVTFPFFSGCGGLKSEYVPPAIILPPHVKSISVKPFENQTSQPGIGNKLWLAVTDEFIRDGRIAYVDDVNKSNAAVVGTVKRYVETELSHDVNLVPIEYQLWVIMDLKFLDRTINQYLWEEPYLEQKLRYFAETEPGGKTIEEAREELWDRFANDIVRRTIEGFGTVTSSSPRSVPHKKSEGDYPPPNYPDTSPY